eukprot:g20592.t1
MVSNDSLVRAEKRLGVPAVVGRYHRALERQLQDDYELGDKVLGTGCSGKVLQATSKATGATAAVKCLSLVGISDKAKRELENEVELFLSMDHPRVARLMDVYETEGRLSLVMECMEGGELFTRVMDREDIKLENFMYARKDTDHLKLIDFGLSKVWEPNTKMEASCGTLGYIAPEATSYIWDELDEVWTAERLPVWRFCFGRS